MTRSEALAAVTRWKRAVARLALGVICASGVSACGDSAPTGPGSPCASLVDAARFFQNEHCTDCHRGNTFPDLRYAALPALVSAASQRRPGHMLVVPGRPEESELYLRLAGPQPTDYANAWFMPVGSGRAHPAPGPVREWILRNAELECEASDAGPPPEPPVITNPNDYPQDLLFTCADPGAPQSSPARLRRINDEELSVASGNPLSGFFVDPIVRGNPLAPTGSLYSTQSGEGTIDGTTLDLLLNALPEASQPWVTRGQGSNVDGRYWTVYDGTSSGVSSGTTPSEADRDAWVRTVLRQGVLFREPSADETQRVRAFLDAELAAEGAYSAPVREETLRTVLIAAHLMAGGLFRSEMGTGTDARRPLSPEELGLAIGRVLGPHPVSATLWGTLSTMPTDHPDWSRAEIADGHLAEIRDAVEDGSITDPSTIARLLERYRGGVDPDRLDVTMEIHRSDVHADVRRERGEYWLAPGIAAFFREWLEVENAETAFKDTPAATSRWDEPRSNIDGEGYGALTSRYRRETLLPMFDDTVARAVVETEENDGDVFRALLTTRMFRVGSNLTGVDRMRPCTVPSDCGDSRAGICYTSLGFCAAFGSTEINRAFDVASDVDDTQAARWVMLPEGARAGVLTHPAWLTAHGGNFEDDASIVRRGRWIREMLLCDDVPGLERVTVAAQLGPSAPELRARDRVSDATERPGSACIACHAEMNPYGYAFEIYNHAGYRRDTDHGQAPDGSTTISNAPDPALNRTYTDATELAEAFADSPYARRCFLRNVFRYFMGRNETPADACTLAAMEQGFAGDSFFEMLETLVTSDAFRYRHDEGGAP